MPRQVIIIAALVHGFAFVHVASALDYSIERTFNLPIGQGNAPDWGRGDSVSYDPESGELVYHVAPQNQGQPEWSQFWWPPDLVSASGQFMEEGISGPVPLASHEPPMFRHDATIRGAVVPGSNGIHTEYDGWKFWPFWPSDTTFREWGLEGVVVSWSFGQVLPPGLDRDFLLQDLYAFPDVSLFIVGTFGDANRDGVVDVKDIDELSRAVRENETGNRFDVNEDGRVNDSDRAYWIHQLQRTWMGDANLDGQFNSGDLVTVFQAGHFHDGIDMNSGWAEGDWNGNGDFESGDLVVAFQDGGYEAGPRAPMAAVPEPRGLILVALGVIGRAVVLRTRQRRH